MTSLTWTVPGLVGKLGCVIGQALVWSGGLEQGEFFKKKKKKEALSSCLGSFPGAVTPTSLGLGLSSLSHGPTSAARTPPEPLTLTPAKEGAQPHL